MKAIFAIAVCAASPVIAQDNCAPRDIAVQNLAERYGESRQIVAMTSDGLFVEMFANESGSWSLLATRADGISCMFGSGQNFEIVSEPLPPAGQEG